MLIGAGGMGEVYRAKGVPLDRDVAIKVLSERLLGDPDAVVRFEREAKAVAALTHPNILAIHDFDREQDIYYATTELLEGEMLRSRISRFSYQDLSNLKSQNIRLRPHCCYP